MPQNPQQQRRRRRQALLKARGVTNDPSEFAWLCRNTNRIGIVAEGDSWFSYPKKWLLSGPNANILDHISSVLVGRDKVNLLRLESNGDEAVEMIAGDQKHTLAEVLKKNGPQVRLLLFSGGGNDVVGKWDMERLLKTHEPGFTAADCIHQDRLKRKLKRIGLAYEELLELRDEYAPDTLIITHTYDLLQPSDRGASFLWGAIRTKPWIHPYLVDKGIPESLHLDIVTALLEPLRDALTVIANRPRYRRNFFVVDTQGTLRPGNRRDWLNEIHPTPAGFKKITRRIWDQARALEPGLPALR
ncbi:MAG: hypothetical protein PVI15_04235 [Chromatiales bacterium]|jgi:hypothetical protein